MPVPFLWSVYVARMSTMCVPVNFAPFLGERVRISGRNLKARAGDGMRLG